MSEVKQTISNTDFSSGMNELVNGWFKRWRDRPGMTQSDWDTCIAELTELGHRYNYKLVLAIGAALVEEIERRDREHEQLVPGDA